MVHSRVILMTKKSEIKQSPRVERIIVKSRITGEPIVSILIDGELLTVTYIDNRYGISKEATNGETFVERHPITVGMAL